MTQAASLKRVNTRISDAVLAFCDKRVARKRKPRLFYMDELTRFVQRRMGRDNVAPDSPSRILRSLRQAGKLNYITMSHSTSLYYVWPRYVGLDSIGGANVVVS